MCAHADTGITDRSTRAMMNEESWINAHAVEVYRLVDTKILQ
jgi:hypothetical protein